MEQQQAEGGMPCDDSHQPETHQFDQQHMSTPSDEQRPADRSGSTTTVLAQHVVKNAMNLLALPHHYGGDGHLERVGPLLDADHIVEGIVSAIRDEAHCLAEENPDVLLLVANRIHELTVELKSAKERSVNWDTAPVLRPSKSNTGLYVANTIAEVFHRMQDEGVVTQTLRDVAAQAYVARAATDVSMYNQTDSVSSLEGGHEMLQLAVEVLKSKHGSLPDGNMDENWARHATGLVSSLMRVALIELRDAIAQGHVGDKDMSTLAVSVHVGSSAGDEFAANRYSNQIRLKPQQALQRKIAERGNLLTTESITRMITEAANRVTSETSGTDVDEAVREHVAKAAQQFIDKVVWEVFEDAAEEH